MSASTDPSISVVMPCYNAMPYLPQALDSALAQTYRPAQIIVVDDGSTDQSPRVLEEYAQRHPGWVQVLRQANAGEPAARNAGIAAATGQWVAMLDGDDWWEPRKLELQVAAAADPARGGGPQCVLVHTGWVNHVGDGPPAGTNEPATAQRVGWCLEALLGEASMGHASIMVRREALTAIGGYDRGFRQACDIDLYFRLCPHGTFAFVPEPLLHHRLHPGQMSARQADQIPFHHRAVRNFFQQHPEEERRLGPERIRAALVRHVELKLQSLYWRRALDDFRDLLKYAQAEDLDSPAIRQWRRRARIPGWVLRWRDRLGRAPASKRMEPQMNTDEHG